MEQYPASLSLTVIYTVLCFSKYKANQVIMSSEASSTTNSRKRKLVASEADEVFVLKKKQERTVTKTVSLCIPDLLEKINDENSKNEPISTPIFKLGNLDFQLDVFPEDKEESGFIGLYIYNNNTEEVMISMTLKEAPGGAYDYDEDININSIEVERGASWGFPDFLGHDAYREWTAENGDEFKVTAIITLHLGEGSSGSEAWETLR